MSHSESYCNASTGANVNGGSDAGSPSMSDTAGAGGWVSTTDIYTSAATNGAVAVGQYLSIYSGAATIAAYTARITAVSGGSGAAWVITLSTTAFSGSEPTTGGTYKAQVGGCWKGPNAAEAFPFNYVNGALQNTSNHPVRVNMKNNAVYNITAGLTQSKNGVTYEGYTTTVGDGGRFTIDGGTSVISLMNLTANSSVIKHGIFSNNGTSGSNRGFLISGSYNQLIDIVFHDFRGEGVNAFGGGNVLVECEMYLCNKSNTASLGGMVALSSVTCVRCNFHDNAGSNTPGVFVNGSGAICTLVNCVGDTNGGAGVAIGSSGGLAVVLNNDIYNNAGAGVIAAITATSSAYIENTNFIKNSSNGITGLALASNQGNPITVMNCGFGSGTQANAASSSPADVQEIGSVTYASNVTPWVDPANGDFRINLAAAIGAGRGAFTETQASYTGSAATPVIGSNQVANYPAVTDVATGVTYANAAYTGTKAAGGGGSVIGSSVIVGEKT